MIETILHVLATWTGMAIVAWLWKNRMENEVGKGISSGKTAPVPKALPVRPLLPTGYYRKSIGSDFKPTKKRTNSPPPDTEGTKNEI